MISTEAYNIHVFLQSVLRNHARKENLGKLWGLAIRHPQGAMNSVMEEAEFPIWPLDGAYALVRWAKHTLYISLWHWQKLTKERIKGECIKTDL